MVNKNVSHILKHYGIGNTESLKSEPTSIAGKKYKLAPAEQEFADSLISITQKYGKLADRDKNGIWVGYVSEDQNDNLNIGVKCSNCYFYEGGNGCRIVKQSIEPGGYCRLAAIPPGLVKG